MFVEHLVDKVSNLHVSSDESFKFGAPSPAHVVQLAEARQQRFIAAGKPDII
jgi:hypothetical protein